MNETGAPLEPITYRPSAATRLLNLTIGAVMLVLAVGALVVPVLPFFVVTDYDFEQVGVYVLFAVPLGIGAAFSLSAAMVRITATPERFTWMNLFFRRGSMAWSDIGRFFLGDRNDAGGNSAYWGIHLEARDGRVRRLHAVQKSSMMAWLGERTAADEVIDELNVYLQIAASPDLPARPDEAGPEGIRGIPG